MDESEKPAYYKWLEEPYKDFKNSISNWEEYSYHRELLFRCIKNIVPEGEPLRELYNKAKSSLRGRYDPKNPHVKRFLKDLERGIFGGEEN